MRELIGIAATILAVAGVILNNHRKMGCFALWIISNTISAGLHFDAGIWSLFARDGIFIILAVEGWRRWSRNELGLAGKMKSNVI